MIFLLLLDDKIHFLHTQEKLISHDIAALALISWQSRKDLLRHHCQSPKISLSLIFWSFTIYEHQRNQTYPKIIDMYCLLLHKMQSLSEHLVTEWQNHQIPRIVLFVGQAITKKYHTAWAPKGCEGQSQEAQIR